MSRAASLKRKLDDLEQQRQDARDACETLAEDLERYKQTEMFAYVMSRCKRIGKISHTAKCTFDNGLVARILSHFTSLNVDLYDEDVNLGRFYASGKVQMYSNETFGTIDEWAKRCARQHDIAPEMKLLACQVLPVWFDASKSLDVESLMTGRVLRWVARQVGGQWSDIITGIFPLK